MKVLLLLAKGFETMEASAFIDVLGWSRNGSPEDVQVVTCGFQKQVVSTFGLCVSVDKCIHEICADEYDALAIPGGFGDYGFYTEAYLEDFLQIIRDFDTQGKWIASVCVAALPIGKSGVLQGRKATTYPHNDGIRQKQLAAFGAEITHDPIVIDRNIITSYGPATAPHVAFTLLEKLTSPEAAQKVKISMGYL